MKITAVETMIVRVPLERPVVTPIHHIPSVENVLVTLRTDAGLHGIAYLWCFGERRARALAMLVEDLGARVTGRDARERARIWAELWGDLNFLGRIGAGTFALSAIDIALWDLAGKAAGQPVWRLLGGAARPIPAYAGGLFLSDPIDAIVAEAKDYVARGFRAMKMRAGAKDWREDIARVEAVRAAIGPDIVLMVDVVQGWTPEQAIRLGRELERHDLTWIEDPVAFDDLDGMARVAAALAVPIAAGENDYAKLGLRRLIEARAIDIAMIDLQRVGGITEWMKAAALAEAWHMPVVPHVFHEISVHVVAALLDGRWLEYVPWWDALFAQATLPERGLIAPPERPGLGLEFHPDTIDRWRIA